MTREENETLGVIEQHRESHHAVARMIAAGMSPNMIRQRTGRSRRSLTLLLADPSFNELVQHYREVVEEKWNENVDHYLDLGLANMIRAESLIADKLEADDEVPVMLLDRISQGRADRFGYGKNSTMKVEHDFAASLDRAIARSGVKTIEGRVEESHHPLALERPKAPVRQPEPLSASFSRVLEQGVKRRRVA